MAYDGMTDALADTLLAALIASADYVQLHTGDPGPAGTANVSSVTTREAVTWGSPSAASVSASNQPAWALWAGTSPETETDITFWDMASAGTFQFGITLTSSVMVTTGQTLTITSVTITMGPIAS